MTGAEALEHSENHSWGRGPWSVMGDSLTKSEGVENLNTNPKGVPTKATCTGRENSRALPHLTPEGGLFKVKVVARCVSPGETRRRERFQSEGF